MGDSLDPHSNPYYKNLKIEDLIYINFPGDIGKVMDWRAYQIKVLVYTDNKSSGNLQESISPNHFQRKEVWDFQDVVIFTRATSGFRDIYV